MIFSHDIGYANIIIICHNFVFGMATNKKKGGSINLLEFLEGKISCNWNEQYEKGILA
jgi:hypothetical protein